jgi:DNA-binding response OmpR family regulator
MNMGIPPDAEKQRESKPVGTDVDENKKTVLIYSPDLNFCFSLSILFQDRYNVVTTTNLGMLERFVGSYSADLMIIDAGPSEKLIERLSTLRETNKHLPIIMLYVYNSKDVKLDRIVRERVDSVFYKPLEISSVSQRVTELLTE